MTLREEDKTRSATPGPAADSLVLASVLNEILRGFHITNFEEQIGATWSFVQELERNLNSTADNSKPCSFSRAELLVLRNAIRVAESELGNGDFSTRVGVSPTIAYRILGSHSRSEAPENE